jgi:hypothetical protein
MAFVPPIGIPDPADSFGVFDPIDTANPNTTTYAPGWPTRQNCIADGDAHDCYYVDNSSGAATDTSNTYGYPDKPRLTLPTALQDGGALSEGAYVEIHGGGATYSTTFRPAGVGTAAAPIWFVGISTPVFSSFINIGFEVYANAAYMVFDGIKIQRAVGGGAVDLRPRNPGITTINNIVFRNCTFLGAALNTDPGAPGVGVGTSNINAPSLTTTNIVIYNCEVAYFGSKSDPQEECGVYPSFYVTNLWLLDSNIHDNAEDGVGGSDSGVRTSSNFYIGRCRIHDNVTNGIDIKQMGTIVISQCEVWNHFASNLLSSGDGENIILHYNGTNTPGPGEADVYKHWPADASVLFCLLHDGDFGIATSSIDRFRAIGNQIFNIRHTINSPAWNGNSSFSAGTAIQMRGVLMNSYVVNNTIYACENGIQWPDNFSTHSTGTIYYRGDIAYDSTLNRVATFNANDNWPTGVSGVAMSNTGFWQPLNIQIWGNIIANRYQFSGQDLYFGADANSHATAVIQCDHNLVYAVSGSNYAFQGSTAHDLAWVRANTPFQTSGITGDPLLSNPVASGFGLTRSSPAIGTSSAGSGVSAYEDYLSRIGSNIQVDAAGYARPLNGSWDMGAFEYLATSLHRLGRRLKLKGFSLN